MTPDTERGGGSRMTRRGVLGLALAGLAGCVSDGSGVPGGEATPTGTPAPGTSPVTPTTANPTPTSSPTPSGALSVSFVGYGVQRSAFYGRQPDFDIVWAPPDRQLLFVMLVVQGGDPVDLSVEDFSLRVDDRTVGAADGVEGQDGAVYHPRPDACACEGEYETYVTFSLSAPRSIDSLTARWDGTDEPSRREPPADARTALAAPTTAWRLESFDAPGTVGQDESFSVTLDVTNAGEAAGIFRGVLNQAGPMHGVSARWKTNVPAGDTIRFEETVEVLSEIDSAVSEVGLRARTVAGDVDHTVAVE